jgi:hypothetical protein
MLIDLNQITTPGLIFLIVCYHLMVMYIFVKIVALYYRKRIEKQVEAFRSVLVGRIKLLEKKIEEYKRMNRVGV